MANPFGYQNSKAIPKMYHQADLDSEDRIFKDSLGKFIQKIGHANSTSNIQNVTSEEVKKEDKKTEEKMKNMKDVDSEHVEFDIAEASKCDDSAMSPVSPRSPMSPSVSPPNNDFEDIFLEADDAPDDAPLSSESEDCIQAIVEMCPDGLDPKGEVKVFGPSGPDIESDPKIEKCPAQLRGFDMDGYADVEAVVNRMLSKVDTTMDMELLVEQLDQYEVVLDLDAEREVCDIVSSKMADVQAQIDSLSSVLKRLVPLADTLSQAWEYVQDVGILYAQASNREKRIAQVKLVAKDLWLQFVEVSRVRKSYDMRFRELKGQWETLSRLITADQNRFQYSKIVHRGPSPYESPEDSQQTKPEAKTPEAMPQESIFETKKNEPLEKEKYDHLDDIPKALKIEEPSGPKNKRIVDWDLDF